MIYLNINLALDCSGSRHSLLANILILFSMLSSERRKTLLFLIVLSVIASFAELISIGSVIPFIALLMGQEFDTSLPFLGSLELKDIFGYRYQLVLTLLFALSIFASALIRYYLMSCQTRFSYKVGSDFAYMIFKNRLHRPYIEHLDTNSSSITSLVVTKTQDLVNHIVQPIITGVSSIIILLTVTVFLILINPVFALVTFISFAIIYFFVAALVKRPLLSSAIEIAEKKNEMVKYVTESLHSIKEIILNGSYDHYLDKYDISDRAMRDASARVVVLGQAPRYFVESLSIIILALISFLSLSSDILYVDIPTLGAIALAAQKIIPLIQQLYFCLSQIRGGSTILRESIAELNYIPLANDMSKHSDFKESIVLQNVGYQYPSSNYRILNNINLDLSKGKKYGVIGLTGSGKSTLINIIMGLLRPNEGRLVIDGTEVTHQSAYSWMRNITHVPQMVFLTDDTIESNIIGNLNYDRRKLDKCIHAADLKGLVDSLGLSFIVGENGARISGGQRQRIAIAKSLYSNPSVLVLDEATSALDASTEANVLKRIHKYYQSTTLISIAHRMESLKYCDEIIDVSVINRVI